MYNEALNVEFFSHNCGIFPKLFIDKIFSFPLTCITSVSINEIHTHTHTPLPFSFDHTPVPVVKLF